MKLLISAYACAPNRGSDHGVGWNWITQAHRLGHEVWALASPVHRELIETTCAKTPDLRGINWTFPDPRLWRLRPGAEPRWERSYNLLWQIAALRHARELERNTAFDAVHHLTWAGIRAPTFLGALSAPLIIGPIGGGETSPPGVRDALGVRGRTLERIRDVSNATILLNPLVTPGFRQARVIFVSTPETGSLFTGRLKNKVEVFSQLALSEVPKALKKREFTRPFKFIYAGRLLYWKAVHIAMRAFAEILKDFPDSRLTIVGSGPEHARLQQEACRLGLDEAVDFIGRVPQDELFDLLSNYHIFIFPSLHDSGGLAALEALSRGLPVVCLNLGGPGELVTRSCGLVIDARTGDTNFVVKKMAGGIIKVLKTPGCLTALSEGAATRASEFLLSQRINMLYERVQSRLSVHPGTS
jgi:glycosyltransferase involved in cell wall biosynthesis